VLCKIELLFDTIFESLPYAIEYVEGFFVGF
jgi:hypothetical protein